MPTEVQIFKDGTVVAADIAEKTITAAKIADKTITDAQIADKTITASQLAAGIVLPVGVIVMWSGATNNIPTGWALCNGTNNTPNLQSRFVVGAGVGYAAGATGGSANAFLVAHTHTGTTGNDSPDHSHNFANFYYAENNGNSSDFGQTNGYAGSNKGHDNDNRPFYVDWTTYGRNQYHQHSFTTSSEGSSGTNGNLPPYYALAFIMKIS